MTASGVPRVALLFGVPIVFEEFASRVCSSDWLAKFNDGDDDALRRRWELVYEPQVAVPLQALIVAAKNLGVAVVAGATLADLHDATETRDVVILFGHWKGAEIVGDDLLQRLPSQFVARLGNSDTPLAAALHREFDPPRRRLPIRKRQPKSVVEILNDAIANAPPAPPSGGADKVLEAPVTRHARVRDELDILFEGLLRPGNRVELFDGLHDKRSVEAALAADFHGVLDLTTCTSTMLGDFIGSKRKHRMRLIEYPTVQEFEWAARCVTIALEMFLRDGFAYPEARLHAGNLLTRAVRDAARELEQ